MQVISNGKRSQEETRRRHNSMVLSDYRAGLSLSVISVEATNFPPRPIIKKDHEAMAKLYGEEK